MRDLELPSARGMPWFWERTARERRQAGTPNCVDSGVSDALHPDSVNHAERPTQAVSVLRCEGDRRQRVEDQLAREEPLEIRVRGRAVAVTMRTPGPAEHDVELAAGFLLTEGVIAARADIEAIEPCGRNEWGNVVNVRLAPLVHVDFERLSRHVFGSSSCGLCGKASIEALRVRVAPIAAGASVKAPVLSAMPAQLRAAQSAFERTGAVHAAGIFDLDGTAMVVREDVGRHNAVDESIGYLFMRGQTPLPGAVLLVSGRISFEIVQKAAAAGIPIVAGVSAPTALAVEFANDIGQTVVGFLREGRMNVYTHGERVSFG
jgi:FdhD protein